MYSPINYDPEAGYKPSHEPSYEFAETSLRQVGSALVLEHNQRARAADSGFRMFHSPG